MALCLEDGQQCGRIRAELEVACAEGLAIACTRRGVWGFTQEPADGGEWLWRGCDQVDPWACLLLADRMDDGLPRPPRARGDAEWLRNQACDLQLDYGCAKLP